MWYRALKGNYQPLKKVNIAIIRITKNDVGPYRALINKLAEPVIMLRSIFSGVIDLDASDRAIALKSTVELAG